MVTQDRLILHTANVAAEMGAMAEHFGADKEHREAVGWLHDYDYEKYPDGLLARTVKLVAVALYSGLRCPHDGVGWLSLDCTI